MANSRTTIRKTVSAATSLRRQGAGSGSVFYGLPLSGAAWNVTGRGTCPLARRKRMLPQVFPFPMVTTNGLESIRNAGCGGESRIRPGDVASPVDSSRRTRPGLSEEHREQRDADHAQNHRDD